MLRFVGFVPSRKVGREFFPSEPFSQVYPFLVERLLHDQCEDRYLEALARPKVEMFLDEKNCLLLADLLEDWMDYGNAHYLVSLLQDDYDGLMTEVVLPALMMEEAFAFCRFLRHSTGIFVCWFEDEEEGVEETEKEGDAVAVLPFDMSASLTGNQGGAT